MRGDMLALKLRLGGPILFSTLSVLTIIVLLLRQPDLTNHLLKIPILGNGVWRWGSQKDNDFADGLRLVVFGDSWVDSAVPNGQEGRGKSWTDTLCAALNCTSKLNFARSQPATSYPSNLPTGVITSNKIHENASSSAEDYFAERANLTLPDLVTQVKSFISRPAKTNERSEAIFAMSIGFWDIYHLAALDFDKNYRIISASIDVLINQVDILYSHFNTNLSQALSTTTRWTAKAPPPPFRLIIPKLMDPSILPGWQTQRPIPRYPSSFAEQQKNAVYLTKRWNALLETKMLSWAAGDPGSDQEGGPKRGRSASREVFFYDFPSYILDLIIERSLEIDGLTDADGLGTGQSPLVDVFLPCVSEEEASINSSEYVELNGRMVCKSPRAYLWWDGWSLGSLASEEVGKRVGKMVQDGDFLGKVVEKETEGFKAG